VLLAALVLNLLNVRITSFLNTVSAYWHIIGVVIIVGALILIPDNHQSFSYVFTETINETGFGGVAVRSRHRSGTCSRPGSPWRNTITGYASPAWRRDPRSLADGRRQHGQAVVVSVVAGFVLLVAITFAIPDTAGAIEAGIISVDLDSR
jgi:hypothetical protein